MGVEVMRELERRVILSVLDRKWREHLYEMDYLREGIYLRAYSQRDPLVEYQREGFDMFAAMMDGIKEEAIGFLFNLQVEVEQDPAETEEGSGEEQDQDTFTDSDRAGPTLDPTTPQIDFAQAQAAAEPAPQIRAKGLERKAKPKNLAYSAPSEDGDAEVVAAPVEDDPFIGTGRNADCPCGSGKKFKKCHGAPGGASGQATVGG